MVSEWKEVYLLVIYIYRPPTYVALFHKNIIDQNFIIITEYHLFQHDPCVIPQSMVGWGIHGLW